MEQPRKRRKSGRPRKDESAGDDSLRESILSAASEFFGALGYPGTTINMIVGKVGVTPAALYWHFKSKEDLLYTMLDEGADQLALELDAAVGDATDPPVVLRRLAEGHTKALLTNPQVSRIDFSSKALSQWLSKEHYDDYHERQRGFVARWRKVIMTGVERRDFKVDDPTITALAIIDMCEGSQSWFNINGPLSPEEVSTRYGDLALRLTAYHQPGDEAALQSVSSSIET